MISIRNTNSFQLFGDQFWDFGVVYSKILSKNVVTTSLGAGLSIVGGSRDDGLNLFGPDKPREPVDPVLGIPLEIQVSIHPINYVGIGLCGYTNINGVNTFSGITLCLQLGKLK